MIKFEKISYEQFKKDMNKLFPTMEEGHIKTCYDNIRLPQRGSSGSAGYDIYSPVCFTCSPNGEPVLIPTGIRAVMPEDLYLQIVPRSSIGFKSGVSLANTVAIIDSDYAKSLNEGHIMLKFVPGFKELIINVEDRIAQGIFIKYYKTDDDDIISVRLGGIGSTGV